MQSRPVFLFCLTPIPLCPVAGESFPVETRQLDLGRARPFACTHPLLNCRNLISQPGPFESARLFCLPDLLFSRIFSFPFSIYFFAVIFQTYYRRSFSQWSLVIREDLWQGDGLEIKFTSLSKRLIRRVKVRCVLCVR